MGGIGISPGSKLGTFGLMYGARGPHVGRVTVAGQGKGWISYSPVVCAHCVVAHACLVEDLVRSIIVRK